MKTIITFLICLCVINIHHIEPIKSFLKKAEDGNNVALFTKVVLLIIYVAIAVWQIYAIINLI